MISKIWKSVYWLTPIIAIALILVLNYCDRLNKRDACLFTGKTVYEDGTYRGSFIDKNEIQVSVQFTLKNGVVSKASFRHLRNSDDYYLGTDVEPYKSVVAQYVEALDYLVGKNLKEHLRDLYTPEKVVKSQVDNFTAATIRSSKIISAVQDALNRGVYSF